MEDVFTEVISKMDGEALKEALILEMARVRGSCKAHSKAGRKDLLRKYQGEYLILHRLLTNGLHQEASKLKGDV